MKRLKLIAKKVLLLNTRICLDKRIAFGSKINNKISLTNEIKN
jgi:hypothetical protein